MATWITVIGRIAQIEGISDSLYKNALVEFEEGETSGKDPSVWRSFYIAFWGDLLETGRSYVIFGTGRLTSNEDCTQPKFTATDVIPFVSEELPVHYVRILVAVELKNTPILEDDGKTYTFEGDVSGYYSDPTPISLRNDKLHKTRFTHTTTQYFYAEVNPRLERVLGSPSMHASTKIFVDGDYRFPVEETSTPGYIEVRGVNFNTTNRTTLGYNAASGTGASVGMGGKRRNVILKTSPAKPRCTLGGSSQASPSPSRPAASGYEAGMSFALGGFGNDPEVDVSVPEGNTPKGQNKRGQDNPASLENSKRQRKPSAKGKEREGEMS